MNRQPWVVYILQCADGTLYTGVTRDIRDRIAQHNAGTGARYTRGRRPVRLIYSEEAPNRATAQRREHAIKRMPRSRKLELVLRRR